METCDTVIGDLAEAASLFGLVAEEIPKADHQLAIVYDYGLI